MPVPPDDADEMSIGVTVFKARCLALIDDVARGKTRRVVLMKHNRRSPRSSRLKAARPSFGARCVGQ
jgi:hypothetical protein